jgi:hypothetical protein
VCHKAAADLMGFYKTIEYMRKGKPRLAFTAQIAFDQKH